MRTAIVATTLFVALVSALSAQQASVTVDHGWARPTPGPNAAIYLTVRNIGAVADRLTTVNCPALGVCMMHQTQQHDGIMSMHMMDGVTIAPGEQVEFRPGERHIMVMNLKNPLVVGSSFPITLHFEHAGDVIQTIDVKSGAQ